MEEFADLNAMLDLTKAPGEVSPVEKLLNELEAHEAKEAWSIEYYKKTLSRMPNSVTRFLMQLIVSDEEKHRAVIHAMVATLKGSLTWTKPSDSLVLEITNSSAKKAAAIITDCSRFSWTR